MTNIIKIGTNTTLTTTDAVSVNGTQVAASTTPTPTSGSTTSTAILTSGTISLSVSAASNPSVQGGWAYDKSSGCALRYFSDGCVVIENNLTTAIKDLVLTNAVLTVDGKTLFSGSLTIPPRSSMPFWVTQPSVQTLDKSKVPPYGTACASLDMLPLVNASTSPNKLWDTSFPDTGSHIGNLGLLPRWEAAYVENPTADNAKVVFEMTDIAATIPCQVVDPATGQLISLAKYPNATVYPNQPNGNPILDITQTSSPWVMSEVQAHAPSVGFLASLIFGTGFHRYLTEAWALYIGALWNIGSYRLNGGNGPTPRGQTRGKAWGLRSLVQAAHAGGPNASMFDSWVTMFLANKQTYVDTHPNVIHVDLNDAIYEIGGIPKVGTSNFQGQYWVIALAYAVQLGYTAAQPILNYFGSNIVDQMTKPIAPQNVPMPALASIYGYQVIDYSGPVADFPAAVALSAKTMTGIANSLTLDPSSQAYVDALFPNKGYQPYDFAQPTGAMGYSALLGAALAMLARNGVPNAPAAYAYWKAHQRVNYTNDPQWDIVA